MEASYTQHYARGSEQSAHSSDDRTGNAHAAVDDFDRAASGTGADSASAAGTAGQLPDGVDDVTFTATTSAQGTLLIGAEPLAAYICTPLGSGVVKACKIGHLYEANRSPHV
jgi:hypothetical protein